MDSPIQMPVTLESTNRKKDRSVSIRFNTLKELTNSEYSELDKRYQSSGWLLFKENEFTEEDIPDEDVETDISKSQSTQLRDVLWVLFKAKGNNGADKEKWNIFYKRNMQAIKARILEEVRLLEEN